MDVGAILNYVGVQSGYWNNTKLCRSTERIWSNTNLCRSTEWMLKQCWVKYVEWIHIQLYTLGWFHTSAHLKIQRYWRFAPALLAGSLLNCTREQVHLSTQSYLLTT